MIARHSVFASFIAALLNLAGVDAFAQPALQVPGLPQTTVVSTPPAAPAAAPVPAPQINTAEIIKRANDSVGTNIEAKIAAWKKELDHIQEELRPSLRYNELNAFRDQLIALRADGDAFWKKLEAPLDAASEQVQKLPPAPAAGQPPEPDQAALMRAEMNYNLGFLNSARNSLDGTQTRVNQLLNSIQDIRRKNFTSNLFQPVPGTFSATTWQNVPQFARLAMERVERTVQEWWQGTDQQGVTYLAVTALVLWLVLTILAWRGVSVLRRWPGGEPPPFWRRASTAAGVILLRSLPAILPLVFLYNAVAEAQPMPENVSWLFYSAARAVVTVVVVNALIKTVLAPGAPEWRLIAASNAAAIKISGLVLTLALVYGVTTFVYAATRIVQAPFSLTLALTLPANLIVALLVVAILSIRLQDPRLEVLPSRSWFKVLRVPVWILAIAIVLTAVSGYLALSRFIAQQLIVTGSILAVVYLLLLWADGLAQGMSDETSTAGSWLRAAGLAKNQRERLGVPISLLLKFAVLICSVPLILLQWGYPWADILELYRQLFFGLHIGNTQVSLAAILASIIVFVLGYFAAKLFQQWLDAQVLKPAGLSLGLRDSIRTGVGYVGVFAAALIALSYAGFNLSNLAIVAGAFSVGIGFGLQSVVSNFVSGLILLAERPIKVGDLVEVGGEEGFVRKISVRSTEIETADRANVLIPNSYFITEKVKNFTLRNNTGRVTIPVGVAYGCDPRLVRTILLKAAQDHLNVMTTPEPFVDFEDFGSDTLNFKLYAFIHDLTKSVATRSDLRMAILDNFNTAGIVIPARQTDITVRDIDWLRDAVKQYMASSYNGRSSGNGTHASAPAASQDE